MVEIRNVGNGRYEVFVENLHWEAFASEQQAEETAGRLARRLGAELGVELSEVEIRRLVLEESARATELAGGSRHLSPA